MKKLGIYTVVISLVFFLLTFVLIKSNSIANAALDFLLLGIIMFVIGFVKEKAGKVNFPTFFHKIPFWIRKVLGLLILADLVWVIVKAGLLGLFLWLMFFNVAIIFCLILLLTKRNSLVVGIILLIVGLFYCFIPLLPGPVLTMPMMKISYLSSATSDEKLLFIWIFTAKWLTLISSIFLFISGFFYSSKKK